MGEAAKRCGYGGLGSRTLWLGQIIGKLLLGKLYSCHFGEKNIRKVPNIVYKATYSFYWYVLFKDEQQSQRVQCTSTDHQSSYVCIWGSFLFYFIIFLQYYLSAKNGEKCTHSAICSFILYDIKSISRRREMNSYSEFKWKTQHFSLVLQF